MNDDTNKLQADINALQARLDALNSSTTIPFEVGEAIKKRVFDPKLGVVKTQTVTSAGAHNQAVNESGSATYSVLSTPTGYLQVVIGSTIYYIPYFS